jgi:hypothetical protein
MKPLKNLLKSGFFVLLLLSLAATVYAGERDLKITEMAVTTKIVRGNPIDSVHRISSRSVKALYCFTRLRSSAKGGASIRHIWYRDNVNVGKYELPVKGENWRTYSKKMIDRGMVGEWRVEALDAEGNLLKSVRFRMN